MVRFQGGSLSDLALDLLEITPVGHYALAFRWGDGHSTGIYSFEYLWSMGEWLRLLGETELEGRGVFPRGAAGTSP